MPTLGVEISDLTKKGLAAAIARAVREGNLTEGHRLPPIRSVASELGVSPTTVAAAWQLLSQSGVIVTDGRRGSAVAPRSAGSLRYRRAVDPSRNVELDLSTGMPDPSLLPDLRAAVRALTGAVTPGSYLDPPVLPELHGLLQRSWPFAVPEVSVVDGAMDALDLIARALLRPGDRVVVETPCFPPLLDLLESHHVDIVPVGLDDEGMDIDGVRAALKVPVRAVMIQPRAQNPTGISTSPRRVLQLAKLLADTDTLVIEDESWASLAQADPISVGTWLPGQTAHVRSFSKSHGPDLRIAAVSGPAGLMTDLNNLRQHGQGWTSRILQRILLELLTDQTVNEGVQRARAAYTARRDRMAAALVGQGIPVTGTDGFNIWVPVSNETSAVLSLANHGIGVAPGTPFQLGVSRPHLRITVSALTEDHDRVAGLIAEAAQGSHRPVI